MSIRQTMEHRDNAGPVAGLVRSSSGDCGYSASSSEKGYNVHHGGTETGRKGERVPSVPPWCISYPYSVSTHIVRPRRLAELRLVEPSVDAAFSQQHFVRPRFHQLPAIEDEDHVGG